MPRFVAQNKDFDITVLAENSPQNVLRIAFLRGRITKMMLFTLPLRHNRAVSVTGFACSSVTCR